MVCNHGMLRRVILTASLLSFAGRRLLALFAWSIHVCSRFKCLLKLRGGNIFDGVHVGRVLCVWPGLVYNERGVHSVSFMPTGPVLGAGHCQHVPGLHARRVCERIQRIVVRGLCTGQLRRDAGSKRVPVMPARRVHPAKLAPDVVPAVQYRRFLRNQPAGLPALCSGDFL